MSVLRGIVIAISTFSQIPTPRVKWESSGMGWALAFLPLVGVCIGAVLLLWCALCDFLQVGSVFKAMGYTVLPLLVSGAIHMDGLCDTADALASNAGPERRQEILHDPHTGAFAVIAVGIYLLVFFGLATELNSARPTAFALAGVFILSRSLGGLANLHFPVTRSSTFAASMRDPGAKIPSTIVLLLWTVAAATLILISVPVPGTLALVLALSIFVLARFWLSRRFGGFSGDLAGWLIQMSEIAALAGLVIGGLPV